MRIALFLALLLLTAAAPCVARDAAADEEIAYLLGVVEGSHARFIRNGKEYPPKEAAAHLRDKLKSAGERVRTAEDFIAGIASKSYLSGKPYLIRLSDDTTQPAGPWLSAALAQHRQAH